MNNLASKHLLEIPLKYRNIYKKAISGKSRTAAIRAKCLECSGFQPKEINNCGAITCPLYPYRHGRGPIRPSL